jgi:chromosome segregation ATPase
MEKDQNNINTLCPAGQVLEAHLTTSANNLLRATESLQTTCKEIAGTLQQLNEYAVRDKEKIDALEKSRECKSKKIREVQDDMQELEVSLSTHFGEHKATEQIKSRLITGGLVSGPLTVGTFEVFRFLLTGKWW